MKALKLSLFTLFLTSSVWAGCCYDHGPGTYVLTLADHPETCQPTAEDLAWEKRFLKRCHKTEQQILKNGTIRFFGLSQNQCVYSLKGKKINLPVFVDTNHPGELMTLQIGEDGKVDEESYFYLNLKDKKIYDAWVGTKLRKPQGKILLYLFDSVRQPTGLEVTDYQPGDKVIFKSRQIIWK